MTENITAPRIIVHGGAGNWEGRDPAKVLDGMKQAVNHGWQVLMNGGSALDAVEQATIILEDNPLYDAGFGSFLNELGEVEMDALIVDGSIFKFGAVAAVRRVKNPITLARQVMTNTDNYFIVGDGADQLAAKLGIPLVSNLEMITDREMKAFKERLNNPVNEPGLGTVGAVAIDPNSNIASATSTGGIPHKKKGRVGDTPIFGAGGYADSRHGAASATGMGENIMRYSLSRQVIDNIANGSSAQLAGDNAVATIVNHIQTPEIGIIVIDSAGNLGATHTTKNMPVAWIDADGKTQAQMHAPYNLG